MKTIRFATLLLYVWFFVSSCSTHEVTEDDSTSDYFDAVGIESVTPISKTHWIYKKFEKSTMFSEANNEGLVSTTNIESLELVTFANYPDKLLLTMTLRHDDSPARLYGNELVEEINVIYNNDNGDFVIAWMQDYNIDYTNKVEVSNQYHLDGFKYLSVTVNTETKELINVERFTRTTSGRLLDMTWEECMELAVMSCADDWQCAVLCGLVFTKCVAAIAIACLF